jgi:type I restriction enzyme R subunit
MLAEKLAEVRTEAAAGRQQGRAGMSREASTFYEFVADLVFDDGVVPRADESTFKTLMEALVGLLQETIGSIDFWQSQDKQKRLRGQIKLELGKTNLGAMKAKRERVAVEIMKLARNRHESLVGESKAT